MDGKETSARNFSWMQCFTTYVSVLGPAYPEAVPELMVYAATIIRVSQDFQAWPGSAMMQASDDRPPSQETGNGLASMPHCTLCVSQGRLCLWPDASYVLPLPTQPPNVDFRAIHTQSYRHVWKPLNPQFWRSLLTREDQFECQMNCVGCGTIINVLTPAVNTNMCVVDAMGTVRPSSVQAIIAPWATKLVGILGHSGEIHIERTVWVVLHCLLGCCMIMYASLISTFDLTVYIFYG